MTLEQVVKGGGGVTIPRCGAGWRVGLDLMILKVSSNPYDSMSLWF